MKLLKLHALSVVLLALRCDAHLSGDASDYQYLDGPEEVLLGPVGVQVRFFSCF